RLFGFKGAAPAPQPTPARLPFWFWIGTVMTGFFWWLMWARVTLFGELVYYAFTPLWWGFILTLDGIVYRRSGGYSLLASRPATFLISVAVSVVGWFFFEYFDYFALGNWYYPNSTLTELIHTTVVILFLVAYTTVWPAIFEWYTLLNTFPKFVARYANGPRLDLPGNLLTWGGLALVTGMVFFPYPLFWAMWVGVLAVFAGVLIRLGIPTPFSAMAQGNWSPMVLMALSALFNGFFWEVWNWGSAHPELPVTNPNYWVYDVPYVNVIHIFAEMPLLGYFGYLPFGLLAWVMFIWAGRVFNFDTALLKGETKITSGG
ncbi:MAG: mechanosensitive ion channel protein MscS, partial [Pseudomonadota bacterium]